MGLCSGVRNSFLVPFPRFADSGTATGNTAHNTSVHPMPLFDTKEPAQVNPSLAGPVSNASGSSSSKDQTNQLNGSGSSSSQKLNCQQSPGQEVRQRKRHQRRRNQEQCMLRGVYFKNMKWQAAIKVDKKQIHLGTVGSQEEAAHLYDRAAFLCGREPNFGLSEEEKQELRKIKWEDFLAMTRHAITNKKTKGRRAALPPSKSEPSVENSDWEGDQGFEGLSTSDDARQNA